MAHLKVQLSKKTIHRKQSARMKNWQQVCRSQYLIPNRYSALCWRPVTHAQTWASYSALYRFGRLSVCDLALAMLRLLLPDRQSGTRINVRMDYHFQAQSQFVHPVVPAMTVNSMTHTCMFRLS